MKKFGVPRVDLAWISRRGPVPMTANRLSIKYLRGVVHDAERDPGSSAASGVRPDSAIPVVVSSVSRPKCGWLVAKVRLEGVMETSAPYPAVFATRCRTYDQPWRPWRPALLSAYKTELVCRALCRPQPTGDWQEPVLERCRRCGLRSARSASLVSFASHGATSDSRQRSRPPPASPRRPTRRRPVRAGPAAEPTSVDSKPVSSPRQYQR